MYKKCLRLLHEEYFKDLRTMDFDSILGFVEDHWMCVSSVPGSCSPKSSTCHPPNWLRLIPDMVTRGTQLFWPVDHCNNEIFPRSSTGEKFGDVSLYSIEF
ncbi:unnamed protein product [Clavelina lepadiformis]|uniref:Uncharacterized protein n=1 Tax=Clavelina lepadiformis TaxID=159417 RepID=A0ABP0H3X4_CLALP